MKLAAFCGK